MRWVSFTLRSLYIRQMSSRPISRRLWGPRAALKSFREETSLATTGNRTMISRMSSPYPLRYSESTAVNTESVNKKRIFGLQTDNQQIWKGGIQVPPTEVMWRWLYICSDVLLVILTDILKLIAIFILWWSVKILGSSWSFSKKAIN